MKARENSMDQKHWKAGDLVMMSCFVYLEKDKLHPNCGQIVQIVSTANSDKANMVVEFETDETEGRGSFLILPREYFLPVPDFCCEEYSLRQGHRAWRLSERGADLFKRMGWPLTDASLGVPA